MDHVILVNIAGLSFFYLQQLQHLPNFSRIIDRGMAVPLGPSFPAVTCPVQATLASGFTPADHGIISNGLYSREIYTVSFWEQPSSLVGQPRIWNLIKNSSKNLTTALLFWQNILYTSADIVITPRPIHLEAGMIPWCYSKPVGYYEELVKKLGEFNLMHYWGPLSSIKSSQWIMGASLITLEKLKPNLLLIYLPQLDYSCQKYGPRSAAVQSDLKDLDSLLGSLLTTIDKLNIASKTGIIVHSEYGFYDVQSSISPNRLLREKGLLAVREIDGKEYLDLEFSKAFGMVDHQVCHLYTKEGCQDKVSEIFSTVPEIEVIMGPEEKRSLQIDHPRSGDLVLMSKPNSWFNYYWWEDSARAPAFAHSVDIHRKPGYDPVELFFDPVNHNIPLQPELVKGSHGRLAGSREEMALCLFDRNIVEKFTDPPDEIKATQIAPTIAKLLGIEAGFPSPSLF